MRWQKIQEYSLSGYKTLLSSKWTLPKDLTNFLTQNNFKQIGSGKNSEVYSHPDDNMVLKVNSKKFDPAFIEFVEFCQKNRGNPHLPRVGKIRMYATAGGKKFFIVLLERLKHIADEEQADDICWTLGRFLFGSKLDSQMGKIPPANRSQEEQDKFWADDKAEFNWSDSFIKQLKELAPLVVQIKANSKLANIGYDLHPPNLMQRGNTIVLSDPVSIPPG